ncbi:MAG: hypothetical protein RJQ01_08585 [Microcella sp.]|uniref:hypothetical protein n=1 Tax=Microcella sp. TaxID=1913979 RepID=UPI003316039A
MLYSQYPLARTRQIIADVLGTVSAIIIITIGLAVTAAIRTLGQFGRDLESAGVGFQEGLGDAAENLGGVPLIGDGIRVPLDAAASAGGAVAEAGRGQQQFVELVAVGAGWIVVLFPLLVLAIVWVWPRARFVRRSATMRRLLESGMTGDTLAMRAMARAPLAELARVHPDPAAAWRARDTEAIRALATLELRRSGLRPQTLGVD